MAFEPILVSALFGAYLTIILELLEAFRLHPVGDVLRRSFLSFRHFQLVEQRTDKEIIALCSTNEITSSWNCKQSIGTHFHFVVLDGGRWMVVFLVFSVHSFTVYTSFLLVLSRSSIGYEIT